MLERRYRAGTGDRTSFALTIVTSLGCNFDCPYCYQVKLLSDVLDDEVRTQLLVDVLDEQAGHDRPSSPSRGSAASPLLATEQHRRPRPGSSSSAVTRRASPTPRTASPTATCSRATSRSACATLRGAGAQVTLDGPAETHSPDAPSPATAGGPSIVILDNVEAPVPISSRSRSGVNLDGRERRTSTSGSWTSWSSAVSPGGSPCTPASSLPTTRGSVRPASTYRPQCLTLPEFAARRARVQCSSIGSAVWRRRASHNPCTSPCTAVQGQRRPRSSAPTASATSAGTPWATTEEVVGHLRSREGPERPGPQEWLRYDPFTDEGCRSCIALPTCMGGCAHHAMLDRAGTRSAPPSVRRIASRSRSTPRPRRRPGCHRAAACAPAAGRGQRLSIPPHARAERDGEDAWTGSGGGP